MSGKMKERGTVGVGCCRRIQEMYENDMMKHQVRPGITGWAQVNGLRGDTSIKKRVEYDLYYIENWTLAFDLRILFMTAFCMFNKTC